MKITLQNLTECACSGNNPNPISSSSTSAPRPKVLTKSLVEVVHLSPGDKFWKRWSCTNSSRKYPNFSTPLCCKELFLDAWIKVHRIALVPTSYCFYSRLIKSKTWQPMTWCWWCLIRQSPRSTRGITSRRWRSCKSVKWKKRIVQWCTRVQAAISNRKWLLHQDHQLRRIQFLFNNNKRQLLLIKISTWPQVKAARHRVL